MNGRFVALVIFKETLAWAVGATRRLASSVRAWISGER